MARRLYYVDVPEIHVTTFAVKARNPEHARYLITLAKGEVVSTEFDGIVEDISPADWFTEEAGE